MSEVEEKRRKSKKTTIFRIFLIPLILIMLIQSVITIGTLVVRRTTKALEEYSISMMNRVVENRRVILQNDMNQRWAILHEQEEAMDGILVQYLNKKGTKLEDFLNSQEMKSELLEAFFPKCLSILQNNSTTGIFVILAGPDMQAPADFDGFFIRDSDPDTNPANYTDLLLERGGKHLSREWNIPLDTSWTTRFHMDGRGQHASDNFFYEPWRAGEEHPDADAVDLGYWSLPFSLEKKMADSYEMITYSLPLRHDGRVYGVLGVEISSSTLYDYFPVVELNASQQSGYMLAVRGGEDSYVPLVGKGVLYNLVRSRGGLFSLDETYYDELSQVRDVYLDKQNIYAVVCPLKLYGSNVPYENTEWMLLGLDTEEDLFGMSRQLYIWMVIAVLVGLTFGVFGIYFVVRHLTRPVQRLMGCISRGRDGLAEFRASNILEIDALYDVMKELTDGQKEAENVLLEEKERYRMASFIPCATSQLLSIFWFSLASCSSLAADTPRISACHTIRKASRIITMTPNSMDIFSSFTFLHLLILLFHISNKLIPIFLKPFCGIIHSHFINTSRQRIQHSRIIFIKSYQQYSRPVFQQCKYRNVPVHIIKHRIQRTSCEVQYLRSLHIFFQYPQNILSSVQ